MSAHDHHTHASPPGTGQADGAAAPEVELLDPHGFEKGHTHGHVIMSLFTLRMVLVVLLVFTALTVFAAQAEHFVTDYFGWHLPHWVNIVGVLTIAVIKTFLVLAFFMQLKYDNPINSVIFCFCLFGVVLFLGFTMIDLGGRGMVESFKSRPVVEGGTGALHTLPDGSAITGPITKVARENKIARVGPEKFAELEAAAHAAHAHDHGHAASDAQRSRPRIGITPGLFDAHAPDHALPELTGTHAPAAKPGH